MPPDWNFSVLPFNCSRVAPKETSQSSVTSPQHCSRTPRRATRPRATQSCSTRRSRKLLFFDTTRSFRTSCKRTADQLTPCLRLAVTMTTSKKLCLTTSACHLARSPSFSKGGPSVAFCRVNWRNWGTRTSRWRRASSQGSSLALNGLGCHPTGLAAS